jgi:uncharacterized protein YunC (DUF1805 family)
MLRIRGAKTLKDLLKAAVATATTAANAGGQNAGSQASETTEDEPLVVLNKRNRDESSALLDAFSAGAAAKSQRLHDVSLQQTEAQVLSHRSAGVAARAAADAATGGVESRSGSGAGQDKMAALAALCATVGSTLSTPAQASAYTSAQAPGSTSVANADFCSSSDRGIRRSVNAYKSGVLGLGALFQAAANTSAAASSASLLTSIKSIDSMSAATSLAWSEHQVALARGTLAARALNNQTHAAHESLLPAHLNVTSSPPLLPNFNAASALTLAPRRLGLGTHHSLQLPPLMHYLRTAVQS